MRDVNSVTQDQ